MPSVREVHNVNVLEVDGRMEISLHLKLPGALSLGEAHGVAEQVERTILDAVPEAGAVRTHLEPLAEAAEGRRPSEREVEGHLEAVLRIVTEEMGRRRGRCGCSRPATVSSSFSRSRSIPTRSSRRRTRRASAVEERIRSERPDVADVHVHTDLSPVGSRDAPLHVHAARPRPARGAGRAASRATA